MATAKGQKCSAYRRRSSRSGYRPVASRAPGGQEDEGGEALQVEEAELGEVQALAQREAAQVPPQQQPDRVDRPRPALLVGVREVLGRVLADGAADREVHPPPAPAQGLDARLQVLDKVPGREAADVLERRAAPEEAGAAREDGVGGVAGEHRARGRSAAGGCRRGRRGRRRPPWPSARRPPRVGDELTDAAAQEAAVADEVVGVARLDEGGVGRELVEAVERRVEVARLGVPLRSGVPRAGGRR